MSRSVLLLGALLLSGCIPAQAFNFPDREKAAELRDPTESQTFNASLARVQSAVKQAFLYNGHAIEKEEERFISATEGVWSRNWSWNYSVGAYLFDEGESTRVTMIVNSAPDIGIPLSLGLVYAAQLGEARQIRIQLFNTIRGLLSEGRL